MKRTNKTTKKQIVEYWQNNIPVNEIDLNFDWSDANLVCWNCGDVTKSAQKCHIIPHMLGGEDVPSNYVLMCNECHENAPNIKNVDDMWNWFKQNKNPYGLYGSYRIVKAFQNFEKRNGFNFLSEVLKYDTLENIMTKFKFEMDNNIGWHSSNKINVSTYDMLLEKIIGEYKSK